MTVAILTALGLVGASLLICMPVWFWLETRATGRRRLVLSIIGDGEVYGQDIVDRSAGMLKRGSVYVLLDRMEDEGLVSSREDALTVAQALALVHGYQVFPRRLYRRRT